MNTICRIFIGLLGATSIGCGSELGTQLNHVPARAIALATSESWMDCTVVKERFKQYCRLSARSQPVGLTVHGVADAEDMLGALSDDPNISDALVPRVHLTVRWEGNPRCWSLGPPTKQLVVTANGSEVGSFAVGVSQLTFPLRSNSKVPLWSGSTVGPGEIRIETILGLRDNEPSPHPDGRSPVPYPLACDIRVSNARLAYDAERVNESLASLRSINQVQARLLRKEKMLHGEYHRGRTASLCFIDHTARMLAQTEARMSGRESITWAELSNASRTEVSNLILDAAAEQLLPGASVREEDDAWEYFYKTFSTTEARSCKPVPNVDLEPSKDVFTHEGQVIHFTGWVNADNYERDLETNAQLKQRIALLESVARAAEASQP